MRGTRGPGVGNLPPLTLPPVAPNQRTWRDLALPDSIPASAASPAVRPNIDKAGYRAALSSAGVESISTTRSDGVKDVFFRRISRPAGLDDAIVGERFIDHVIDDHPRERRAELVEFVIPAVRDPGEIWGQWREVRGRQVWQEYNLAVFPKANIMVMVREDPKLGALVWTTHKLSEPSDISRHRRGQLIYRKPESRER